jgi:hypothetical protein
MSTRAVLSGATALLATAAPAWADLSAEGLWADWQKTFGAFGLTLSADAAMAGDTLTLSDFTTRSDMGGVENVASYGTVQLVEQGDGTVRVLLPPEMRATSTTTVEGETVEQDFTISHEGLDFVVAELDGARTYVFDAERLIYAFDDVVGEGDEPPVEMSLALTAVDSAYTIAPEGASSLVTSEFAANAMNLILQSEGEDAPFTVLYDAVDLTGEGGGTFDEGQIGTGGGIPGGLNMAFNYAHGGATMSVTARGEDGPVNVNASSNAGALAVGIDADGLSETLTSAGVQASVQVPEFPAPLAFTAAEVAGGFLLPLGAPDAVKPFGMDFVMREVEFDDAIWSTFDPTGQLPRDAATLVLDIDGTAEMAVDLSDAEAMVALGARPPGELETLSINEVRLSVAGAELRAAGELAFPTPDPSEPVGRLVVNLDGAFALADRLVALGFVPAEQVAFVKGMSGAVARSVGEDQLESELTFTEGGGIAANGMPLR